MTNYGLRTNPFSKGFDYIWKKNPVNLISDEARDSVKYYVNCVYWTGIMDQSSNSLKANFLFHEWHRSSGLWNHTECECVFILLQIQPGGKVYWHERLYEALQKESMQWFCLRNFISVYGKYGIGYYVGYFECHSNQVKPMSPDTYNGDCPPPTRLTQHPGNIRRQSRTTYGLQNTVHSATNKTVSALTDGWRARNTSVEHTHSRQIKKIKYLSPHLVDLLMSQ